MNTIRGTRIRKAFKKPNNRPNWWELWFKHESLPTRTDFRSWNEAKSQHFVGVWVCNLEVNMLMVRIYSLFLALFRYKLHLFWCSSIVSASFIDRGDDDENDYTKIKLHARVKQNNLSKTKTRISFNLQMRRLHCSFSRFFSFYLSSTVFNQSKSVTCIQTGHREKLLRHMWLLTELAAIEKLPTRQTLEPFYSKLNLGQLNVNQRWWQTVRSIDWNVREMYSTTIIEMDLRLLAASVSKPINCAWFTHPSSSTSVCMCVCLPQVAVVK